MPAYLSSFLGGAVQRRQCRQRVLRLQHGASQTGEPGFRRHLLRVDPDQQFRQSRRLFPEWHPAARVDYYRPEADPHHRRLQLAGQQDRSPLPTVLVS